MTIRYLAILLILAASGCATVPNQPYNKMANERIRTIAVVTVPDPAQYEVGMLMHPTMGFGLVGGLIAAADTSSKTKTFSDQDLVHHLALGNEMTIALNEAFAQNGMEVIAVDGGKGPRTEFLKDYPVAKCDAYLDVAIALAGYRAQYASTPYLPTLFAPVRLVDARTKTVLYTTEVFITDGKIPKGGEQISPNASYSFVDFKSLTSDPDKAVKGLKEATRKIAAQIAADLK
ncbi:MAG: hypothetical protein ABI612_10235 [Betaproteobacteria bacterium]